MALATDLRHMFDETGAAVCGAGVRSDQDPPAPSPPCPRCYSIEADPAADDALPATRGQIKALQAGVDRLIELVLHVARGR